jgi:hypothetical protein
MNDAFTRWFELGLTCMTLSALLGCQRGQSKVGRAEKPPHENGKRVRAALTALLHRENGSFVIFEEKKSGKFVQFAGSKRDDLNLDLPAQTLDRREDQRAEVFFKGLGVRPEEYDVFDGPGGKIAGRQRSFQKAFGRDVEAAATVVMQVFERVYQFPTDFELAIKEE